MQTSANRASILNVLLWGASIGVSREHRGFAHIVQTYQANNQLVNHRIRCSIFSNALPK